MPSKKPVGEGYKDRLAQWIETQLDGGKTTIRELGEAIGISHASISRWKKRQLSGRISCNALKGIAKLRGELSEETEAWLEGRPVKPSLQRQMEAFEARLRTLEGIVLNHVDLPSENFADFVKQNLRQRQVSLKEFESLVVSSGKLSKQRLAKILKGEQPTDDELDWMAVGLKGSDGQAYNHNYLLFIRDRKLPEAISTPPVAATRD